MPGKRSPNAPERRDKDGRAWFKNTFGPPHCGNKEFMAGMVLMALQYGVVKAEKLPDNVLKAVNGIPHWEDGETRGAPAGTAAGADAGSVPREGDGKGG